MTVDNAGYEEAFDDVKRRDVEPASEVVKTLQKKLEDVSKERDNLSNEVKVIKEKTQPELLHELKEIFYDKPGLLDAKQLQKVSEKAGRDLETILQRYKIIIKSAIESGEPVPIWTYIITKPDMKLVPVRITIDFEKKTIDHYGKRNWLVIS
jgi:predicted transcriptional regulator